MGKVFWEKPLNNRTLYRLEKWFKNLYKPMRN